MRSKLPCSKRFLNDTISWMVIPPPSPILAMFSFVPVTDGESRFHAPLIARLYWGDALHRLDMVEPLVLIYMEKALDCAKRDRMR